MRLPRLLILSLIVLLFAAGAVALAALLYPQRTLSAPPDASRAEFAAAAMRYANIPGMAIVTVRNGKIDRISTHGWADAERRVPVGPDTLFNVASISKPLLGILLLQAERDGLLSLDADINDYLPFKVANPKAPGRITLRHIATHTSGIADFFDFQLYCMGRDCAVTLEDYLRERLAAGGRAYAQGKLYLPHAPGTYWAYSNLATTLAGYILERRSGKTLDALSRDVVFGRLLATTASWKLDGLPAAQLAVQYEVQGCLPGKVKCFDPQSPNKTAAWLGRFLPTRVEGAVWRPYPPFGNPQYPDGGVRTSIRGLGNLMVNLLANHTPEQGTILDPALYAEMFRVQVPPEVQKGQRFFWRQNDGAMLSDDYIGHIGADYGLFTTLFFDPRSGNGIAVLMNRDIDDSAWQAMAAVLQRFREGRL